MHPFKACLFTFEENYLRFLDITEKSGMVRLP